MAKVILDAGHGGRDAGASYMGRLEKNDTLALAFEVGRILAENGVEVVYTRDSDIYQTPFQKAQIGNESGADLFISLHRNSSPRENQYSGVESLVFREDGIRKELAENINRELTRVGFEDQGIRERPGIVVLRRTGMPAVLVEVGFINTEADNQLLDQNFNRTAEAIADGILMTLGENNLLPEKRTEAGITAMDQDIDRDQEVENRPENIENEKPARYRVQVGAFRRVENAERLLARLLEDGFPAKLEEEEDFHFVWVGDYDNLDNAAKMEQVLRNFGYATYIVTVSDS